MALTIKQQKRRNEVISKIRQLQARRHRQGGLSEIEDNELLNLEKECKTLNGVYW